MDGGKLEVVAGFRRYWALKKAGINKANIQAAPYTDDAADLVHHAENKKRKNKSVYSQGLEFQTMMASGRYESERELARKLQANPGNLSIALSLVSDAPEGMWAKVSNKSQLSWVDARKLIAAFKVPSFAEVISAEAGKLEPNRLMGIARKVIRNAERGSKPKSKIASRLTPMLNQEKDGSFTLQLPSHVSKDLANEILSWVEHRLSQ